jgi:hypothetical protein
VIEALSIKVFFCGEIVVCDKTGIKAKDVVGRRCTIPWGGVLYHGTVQSYVHKSGSPVYPISFCVFHDEDQTVVLYNSRHIISRLGKCFYCTRPVTDPYFLVHTSHIHTHSHTLAVGGP